MKSAWVTTNVLDLWTSPKYNSERASQLLFSELVTVEEESSGFARVVQSDGYTGWADVRFLSMLPRDRYKEEVRRLNATVKDRTARIVDAEGKEIAPYFLYYGTKLHVSSSAGRNARVVLPDGEAIFLKKGSIAPINGKRSGRIAGSSIMREARRFLGTPYLWGGVTPAGFDCSGFVMMVLARFSIHVPRDTKEQILAGKKVDRMSIKSGDLLFFKRHVGIAIGRDRLIHSSVGGGGVRINSMLPGAVDYRQDLDENFNQARRLL